MIKKYKGVCENCTFATSVSESMSDVGDQAQAHIMANQDHAITFIDGE